MRKASDIKTFILKWNPEISSVNLEDWDFCVRKQDFLTPNWSVHEHEKVNVGDEWYMLRVGDGVTGIVGHGLFCSNPQKGDDWSEQGKVRYYAELYLRKLMPHSEPMITTKELEKCIPNVDWRGGHSGILLSNTDAEKLDNLRSKYYEDHPCDLRSWEASIEKGIEKDIQGWENLTKLFDDMELEDDYIYSDNVFHDMVTLKTEHIYDDSVFTFTILIHDNDILPVICRKLQRIKTEIHGGECYESYARIWHDGYYFHVNINEVEVICEELEFGETCKYEKDFIAVTI